MGGFSKYLKSPSNIFAIVFIFLVVSCASQPESSLRILQHDDSLDYQFKTDISSSVIEVCSTQLCHEFVASDPEALEPLANFVLVYIVYVSGFGDIDLANGDNVPPVSLITRYLDFARSVVKHELGGCPQYSEIESTLCFLRKFQRRYDISLNIINYDEGRNLAIRVL